MRRYCSLMFKRLCIYCGAKSCKWEHGSLCDPCWSEVIKNCNWQKKTIYFEGEAYVLNYFWEFKNIVRKMIIAGKYKFNKYCFESLSKVAVDNFLHVLEYRGWAASYVPTTYLRYCYRGYNQSKLIAKEFLPMFKSSEIEQDFSKVKVEKFLMRTKYIRSQMSKNREERVHSENQFEVLKYVKRADLPDKIVIFDDVCTTGATIASIGKALRKVNPDLEIEFFTLAYTPRQAKK